VNRRDPLGLAPLWLEVVDIVFTVYKSLFLGIKPLNPNDIEDQWLRDRDRQELYDRIDQLEKDLPELKKRIEDEIKDLERRKQWEKENQCYGRN
jgi:hypothetical protein